MNPVDTRTSTGHAAIGVAYPDTYAVEETFQLLKAPCERYVPGRKYDIVIARKADVPGYSGPLIDLTEHDIFREVVSLLNTGRPHLHEPACDLLLDELRSHLKKNTVLAEIPPAPFDNPYMVALTHDVDVTSVRECRLMTAGYAAFRCFRQGDFASGIRLLLARFGIGKDPWALFPSWKELEESLHVRSTFFFVPKKGEAGILAHRYRAVRYAIPEEMVEDLTAGGWEAGIHGIDNWTSAGNKGRGEVAALGPGHKNPGNRTHWLLSDAMSFRVLDEAGYSYDSSFGYNDDAGFRAGTLQVYRPRGTTNLVELPLHIQDVGLLGESCYAPAAGGWERTPCLHLDRASARSHCERIIGYAKEYGGAVTLLWHYENIAPPRDWSGLYTDLVQKALADGAWVTTARRITDWFRGRRAAGIGLDVSGTTIIIRISGLPPGSLPGMRVRLHIEPARIAAVDAEYRTGNGYVDIRCNRPEITVKLQ